MLVVLAVAAAAVVAVALVWWQPLRWEATAWLTGKEPEGILVLPDNGVGDRVDISAGSIEVVEFAKLLSHRAGVNVIVPGEHSRRSINVTHDMTSVTTTVVLALLRENGWRLRPSRVPGEGESGIYTLEPAK